MCSGHRQQACQAHADHPRVADTWIGLGLQCFGRNPQGRSLLRAFWAFCARCFFPPGCEQASVLWLAAANNDLEAFLERAASWVPAVFCWSCQHKQCRQGEETQGILVSRTHYVCLPIPFFTSQEIQHCLFLRTAHQSSDLFEDRFDALCIEENIVGSFRFSIYHFFPTKISRLAKDL